VDKNIKLFFYQMIGFPLNHGKRLCYQVLKILGRPVPVPMLLLRSWGCQTLAANQLSGEVVISKMMASVALMHSELVLS
jgi:hypothetical protein